MQRWLGAVALIVACAPPALGQTPQPFPRPGPAQPAPAPPQVPAREAEPTAQTPLRPAPQTAPDAATLGFPVFPSARYLTSYDAGMGQRYHVFGTAVPFADIVAYYRAQLGTRGNLVFREPATHMFEVGRFRDDAMAFPPGVTVKDWTWGGSPGYPNPQIGGQPARFPTIIMIVPPPAAQ